MSCCGGLLQKAKIGVISAENPELWEVLSRFANCAPLQESLDFHFSNPLQTCWRGKGVVNWWPVFRPGVVFMLDRVLNIMHYSIPGKLLQAALFEYSVCDKARFIRFIARTMTPPPFFCCCFVLFFVCILWNCKVSWSITWNKQLLWTALWADLPGINFRKNSLARKRVTTQSDIA